jgi:hypothetical protein
MQLQGTKRGTQPNVGHHQTYISVLNSVDSTSSVLILYQPNFFLPACIV